MKLIDCITIISIDHKLHISYVLPLTRVVTLIRPVDSFMIGINITSIAIKMTNNKIYQRLGVRPMCQHNFENNRKLKEPRIMLE